jgi:hypothetical protein
MVQTGAPAAGRQVLFGVRAGERAQQREAEQKQQQDCRNATQTS